jgi:hypothetical protein
MFDHVGARTGWDNDVAVRFFEGAYGLFGHRARFGAQARIEERLPAAGLVAREVHAQAEAAKNFDDGLAGLRVEGIDEAGDEKLHIGHVPILTSNPKISNPESLV